MALNAIVSSVKKTKRVGWVSLVIATVRLAVYRLNDRVRGEFERFEGLSTTSVRHGRGNAQTYFWLIRKPAPMRYAHALGLWLAQIRRDLETFD